MSELWRLTAAGPGGRFAAGEITFPRRWFRSCLERIEDRDPDVEAWTHLDPDYALAGAREADSSPAKSPLHGVPFAVKDVIDSGELPTEYGAPAIHGGHRPERDAACVAAMRSAGAVLMGKTVSTEFATFWPGKTKNPHNPGHTPGGSSSGPAAVGASMVPVAFGNRPGSLIAPRSVASPGLKAPHGHGRPHRHLALEPTILHARLHGPVVDDLGLFYDISARRGSRRATGWPDAQGRALRTHHCRGPSAARRRTRGRKFPTSAAGSGRGRSARRLPPPFPTAPVILNAGPPKARAQYADHRDRLSERLRGMIEEGLATTRRRSAPRGPMPGRAARRPATRFGDRDVLLTRARRARPGRLGITATRSSNHLDAAPCPAYAPLRHRAAGLPIGAAVIGSRGEDTAALAVAKWSTRM